MYRATDSSKLGPEHRMAINPAVEPISRGRERWTHFWILAYLLAAVLLFLGQIMTGTGVAFAAMVLLFHLVTGLTIRVLGGVWNLFGLSVGVLALQHVTVSQVAKAIFLQPADTPLQHPLPTMLMYTLGMCGILTGSLVYRFLRIDKAPSLLKEETDARRLTVLSLIFTGLSVVRFFLLQRYGVYEGAGGGVYIGGWVGPLRQLTFITVLAVAYGTASVIISSKGRRCVGPVNFIAIIAPVLAGILGAVRADTAGVFVTFVLTCIAFQFKFRFIHYAVAVLAGYFFQFIMFPYALYARNEGEVRIGGFEERISKAASTLSDVITNPGKYKDIEKAKEEQERYEFQRMRYFGRRLPTLDRYSMIIVNDEIVEATQMRGTTGWQTTQAGLDMLIPRFLNPKKEAFGTSNWIARQGKGLVGADDTYTQITLGYFCDGYISFKWAGVYFFSVMISLAYFAVYHLVLGGHLHRNVYSVSLAFIITWIFSEGTIQAQILNIVQYPIFLLMVTLPAVFLAASLTKRWRSAAHVYEASARPAQTT